jgi:hypothetical protein
VTAPTPGHGVVPTDLLGYGIPGSLHDLPAPPRPCRQQADLERSRRPAPVVGRVGITTQGKPVFIGLDAAAGESDDAWDGFLRDLGERGLARLPLVISDGSAGLIGAAERTMPSALRQRCGPEQRPWQRD